MDALFDLDRAAHVTCGMPVRHETVNSIQASSVNSQQIVNPPTHTHTQSTLC